MTGRARPISKGGRVSLQRRTRTGWTTALRGSLSSEGLFSFGVRPRTSGLHTYRGVTAGDGVRRAGAGRVFQVSIYDAEIMRVAASDPVAEACTLNSEYVSIRNTGNVPVSLSRWQLTSNHADVGPGGRRVAV